MLPQEILDALIAGKISEGHTRPLLMLVDRPAEQITLFKEMLMRKMTVREAERLARKVAYDKVRKKSLMSNPEVIDLEEKLAESLGTRVHIEPKDKGGKITIDYFSHDELLSLTQLIKKIGKEKTHEGMFDKIRKEMNLSVNSPIAEAIAEHYNEDSQDNNTDKEQNIIKDNNFKNTEINSQDLEVGKNFIPEANRNMSDTDSHIHTLPEIIDPEEHIGEIILEPVKDLQVGNNINLGAVDNNLSYEESEKLEDDRSKDEIQAHFDREDDLYDLKNFSL